MNAVGETELDRYLRDLMAMVARATPGAFVIGRTGDRRYALTAQDGRSVAVVNRRSDAEIFPPLVRAALGETGNLVR